MTDLSTVPLVALSNSTKDSISSLLNPTKCIPSDDGLPRDWRGLAHLSGLGGEAIPNLSSKQDPCGYILSIMQEKVKGFTFLEFQNLLERLDRWDIIDDTTDMMEKDAQSYKERSERLVTSANIIETDVDEQILTYDDSIRLQQGLDKQYYDAFLLFADEDVDFADEITENLENKYGLKLCRKDRDFIVGLPFEHSATMTLISERCNRLVVIVSTDFLKSSTNKFLLNFTQALSIDKRQRKIIPCVYKACQIPPELSYYFRLDYNRAGKFWDFWSKLRDSVKTPDTSSATLRSISASTTPSCTEKSDTEKSVCSEEGKNCCVVETTCTKVTKISCHPGPQKCAVENSEIRTATVCDKKSKGLLRQFRTKKSCPQKRTEVECPTKLNTSQSLPSLDCSINSSSVSLRESNSKKKNFVNKCVTKVRALMKS